MEAGASQEKKEENTLIKESLEWNLFRGFFENHLN
jgi:hypothetical protein